MSAALVILEEQADAIRPLMTSGPSAGARHARRWADEPEGAA